MTFSITYFVLLFHKIGYEHFQEACIVKPKAVNVLERYDLEVLRTWKVRGAIVCEADKGLLILKEFGGSMEKLLLQDSYLTFLRQHGFLQAEELFGNQDGELLTKDADGCGYIVKTYAEGRECNAGGSREALADGAHAMRTLAKLHGITYGFQNACETVKQEKLPMRQEFEKHNRELKKVRRFLKEKSRKSEFEHFLQQHYDLFLEQALSVTKRLEEEQPEAGNLILCHGDFQYHNVLFCEGNIRLFNFEKCTWDDASKDIYHFSRKMLEKNDWQQETGEALFDAYEKELPLSKESGRQLYYRFSYPEKFWKIVNYYYNRGKAFIPDKNREKLEAVLEQEEKRTRFIRNVVENRFIKR